MVSGRVGVELSLRLRLKLRLAGGSILNLVATAQGRIVMDQLMGILRSPSLLCIAQTSTE